MSSGVAAAAPPRAEAREGPYQGLVPFREEDAPYFKGRTREVDVILANLRSRRVTILYGPSGSGKSSALGAGLLPRLRQLADDDRRERAEAWRERVEAWRERAEVPAGDAPRAALAYCLVEAWRDAPLAALAAAVHRAAEDASGLALDPWTPGASLADAVRGWRRRVRSFLVILDQFEDYFLYHPHSDDGLADELVELMTATDVTVNLLVSLREDAHARLDRFADDVPELYSHQIRLEHLDRAGAEDAIRGPVEEHNRHHDADVVVEDDLVAALLDRAGGLRVAGAVSAASAGDEERRGEGIEASYLQLVLTRLWQEEARHPPPRMRAATLNRLGGPAAIVARHVEETLAGLSPAEQETAADLFEHLVTPSRTKFAQSVEDLAVLTKRDLAEVQGVVDALTDRERRLLRAREPVAGVVGAPSRVEIYHDSLADPILAWGVRVAERAAARRNRRRLALWGGLALAIAAGLAVLALYAFVQRAEADGQKDIARSQAFAASSLSVFPADPDLALSLAVAALDENRSALAEAQLRSVVAPSAQRILPAVEGGVSAVAFSRDGRWLASAGLDGAVHLWDPASGRPGPTLRGAGGAVLTVAFSPDGHRLASSSLDGTVRLWDPASGRAVQTLKGHQDAVLGVAFSPDGRKLASASLDGTVRLWDAASGRAVQTLRGHQDAVLGVAFSPDGRTLASADAEGIVRLWDRASGRARQTLEGGRDAVFDVAFSPDQRTLASAGADGTVRLWDPASGRALQTLRGHQGAVSSVAFSPDGRTLATAGLDGTVRLWNPASREAPRTLERRQVSISDVAFSPDGSLASAGDDGSVRLWDPASAQAPQTLRGGTGTVLAVAFSPDGQTLASAGANGIVRLWDPASGLPQRALVGHRGNVYGVAFSPDGHRLAAVGDDGTVRLWDLASGRAGPTLKGQGSAYGVAFSPDGGTLASAGASGIVRLWDPASDRVQTLESQEGSIRGVVFSPHDGTLAIAGGDGTVRLWDPASTEAPQRLPGHEGSVFGVAFSPDGRTLASAGADGTVRLWDPASRQALQTLRGHLGNVYGVAFSPDGRTLASAGADGTVRLWDQASGWALQTLKGQPGSVRSVAVGSDGRDETVASAGADGALRVFACRACMTTQEAEGAARPAAHELAPAERERYGGGGG